VLEIQELLAAHREESNLREETDQLPELILMKSRKREVN
jgi:hypothetical protein